jgi:chitinase
LNILLSVGGWSYSQDGHFSFVTDATKRATFVSSAVSLVENYGLDGMCVLSNRLLV